MVAHRKLRNNFFTLHANNYYDDDINQDYGRGVGGDDEYWSDEYGEDNGDQVIEPRAYNVYFEGGYSPEQQQESQPSWEKCADGKTWVLLPPSYVSKPTAVVHWVGGTFFGSSPKLWYKSLLEGIVKATQCAVVATAIPVALFRNPLQHVSLTKQLQRQFENAVLDVLEDEYGDFLSSNEVPIVGMGHSLGARLLMVSSTLGGGSNNRRGIPDYKSYVLMSFTNYGASVSVPGVEQLLAERRSLDDKQDDLFDNNQGRRGRNAFRRRGRRNDDWLDYDDDDYDDDRYVLEESIRNQATRFKDALTPRSEELEFYPTPDQLWKAITTYDRYTIPQTLLIQFEDDPVDQSARLASSLVNSSSVYFARLKGNHLTPVSAESQQQRQGRDYYYDEDDEDDGWLRMLPSKASQLLWKAIQGKSAREKSASNMRDLRQSIVRYLMDVATK